MKKRRIIMLALCILFAAGILVSTMTEANAAVDTYQRTWTYLNVTLLISPNLGWTIMPGHRYEFSNTGKEDDEGVGNQFYEFFTGPVFISKLNDNVTFKLPLWYYYMGFPNTTGSTSGRDNNYYYSHNFEIVPIFEVKLGSFVVANRIILHNKLYANNSVYTRENQRRGWSMLLREMITVTYNLTPSFALTMGDEVFFGMIEDRGTNGANDVDSGRRTVGEPFFEGSGFSMNRFYAGFIYRFTPFVNVVPQYILETNHNTTDDYELKSKGHYLFVTVNYTFKMFQ
ncbi:MAG: DUF2490 domain-containing protein [Spirochaetes bacterium]|nr:DUF2490 domain-containing protein [Spirochaetota bacterium]